MGNTIKVLDKGFVTLVDYMASDLDIINAARVSLGKVKEEFDEDDTRLLKYLWDNKHGTVFEAPVFKFRVKAPIFVVRQWFRHRIASYNEKSLRYTSDDIEFHIPSDLRSQAKSNKQSSVNGGVDNVLHLIEDMEFGYLAQHALYIKLLDAGVCREQAREVLPVALYTEFLYQVNLRSLINFISLRNDSHAQEEIRVYAKAMLDLITPVLPESVGILKELQYK